MHRPMYIKYFSYVMLAADTEILFKLRGQCQCIMYIQTDPHWCLHQNSVLLGLETLSLGSWFLTF